MNNENNNVENSAEDNSKALSDLIQSIQAKIGAEEIDNTQNDSQENSNNLNSILNNLDISSILSNFSNNSNEKKENDNFSGFDPSFLFKIQRIMSSLTKDDPKKNLLISLKPFLRKSRQDKINEYISMLTILNAIEVFNDKGSDKNV